ncbi:NB-ARC domain-containing protein [Streptomyces sp. CC228A]|uniref:NB-ARC domain-containing protein n=1 Tax=Streptomyces sp. CC228A TaxID=2898186 RepID=UPI001F454F78|nr:NB-ARC domain-containing protein [Streptomyces sp. CC228A]
MTTRPGDGGVFGNTFNGPAALQIGNHNQQTNTFHFHATQPPPPQPAAPEVPGWWVVDRDEADHVISTVCSPVGGPVGITTALEGAGGFGKTTLAQIVRASPRVRQHFRGGVYFFVVGRDVDSPQAVSRLVHDVTLAITGRDVSFDSPDRAGEYLGQLLEQRPDQPTLLIFDDVWTQEQLDPLLTGGDGCVRLVTTRVPAILPPDAKTVRVDAMSQDQALQVLTWELPDLPQAVTKDLVQVTGGWPLLLRLANRLINRRVRTGADAASAAADLLRSLRERGPAAVDKPTAVPDLGDPKQRATTVRATVEASIADLCADSRARFAELGIFAHGEAAPIPLVATLWRATANLDEWQTRDLCADLHDLSLLAVDDADGGHLSLHDVIRDYLRAELGPDRLTEHHAALVDAVQAGLPPAAPLTRTGPRPPAAWWELTDPYLLDHAITHLLAAHRTEQAEALACDLRWIETRLHHRGPTAPWTDCARIPTPTAAQRARDLSSAAHLLGATEPAPALTTVLHSRLRPLPAWRDQVAARERRWPHLALRNRRTPPDLPHPALLRTLTGHTGTVHRTAVAPDGTWLATASEDRTVRIWDSATGRETACLTGHTGKVRWVAIAPDGTWLASAGDDRTVRIWERATGQEISRFTGHTRPVHNVEVAPNGLWLASACDDGTVRIWDPVTGRETARVTGHSGLVHRVAITPDSTRLATTCADGNVRIWDPFTGQVTACLSGHEGPVRGLAVAPDGTWLATAGDDKTVRVWDLASGQEAACLTGHTYVGLGTAVASDGTWFATTGGNTLKIWDRATGRETASLAGPSFSVNSVAIAPDGTWLVTTGGNTGQIWDSGAVQGTAPRTGRSLPVETVMVAPKGTWLACVGHDGKVRIWDWDADRETACLTEPWVKVGAIAPVGTRLATIRGNTVQIWDSATGEETNRLTGHDRLVNGAAISPDGTWLVTTGSDGTVQIWDSATGGEIIRLTVHTDQAAEVTIAPDGTWLATTGMDGTVRIWDRATGQETARFPGATRYPGRVTIAPDGTWFATISDSGTVRVWDRATGRETVRVTGHAGWVNVVAVSPDGTWFATTGGYQATVWIWDRGTGQEIARLTGHTGRVTRVAVSPDGARLATASDDGTVRVWDPGSGRAVTMMRTDGILYSCAWTPDGRGVVVGGTRGVYVYEFHCGTPDG